MNKRLEKLIEARPARGKLEHRVSPATLRKIEKDFGDIAQSPKPWPSPSDIQGYFLEQYGVDLTPNTIRSRLRGAAK